MVAVKGAPVPSMRGENNAQAVLTWAQVRSIREEYIPGSTTHKGLAEKYGVSRKTVARILANIKWIDPDYTPLPR